MKCGVCQRDLSRDEAVYRVRTGYGSGVSIIVACSQCAKKWDREWYPAKLCCNCQRPTFVDHHRNGLRFFVCGSHCRWAVEYARRHQRPDARACAVCVQEFTPQRNNGLYCSPGCKNRAYRARTQAKMQQTTQEHLSVAPPAWLTKVLPGCQRGAGTCMQGARPSGVPMEPL